MIYLTLLPRPWVMFVRRAVFGLLSAVTVILATLQAWEMARTNGVTGLEVASLVLFVILVTPIALSFWTAAIGFLLHLTGGDPLDVTRRRRKASDWKDQPRPRTALVMPVYNEDPGRVFAGLKATYKSLEETGRLDSFDFYVLSDTMDPDLWVREELAFSELRREVSDPDRLFYRKRRENLERKAGNIADFCATWGERYKYMIVFDADSVMTGTSLIDLVGLMEENPGVGLIQAPPLPVNRRSLFGRLQQFASHLYGLNFTTGLNFWQGGEGNYWGHNAIIRIRPFVEHCRLPKLPGKEPLGGSILSHDFVEAAMLRRGGWRVYLATELRGSYEEVPATLVSHAARDRRWCQGNLQHARLLFTPGYKWINRVHLWMGVMSYVAPPLWLLLLIIGTAEGLRSQWQPHRYFPSGPSLFPDWQVSIVQDAVVLFTSVMTLLLLPKFLSLMTCFRYRERLAAFGGAGRLTISVILETLFSVLLAPILAFLQTHFVVTILSGRNVKWVSPSRSDDGTPLGEAIKCHWGSTVLGIGWSVLLIAAVPKLFWWFSPVLAGFVLAIPLSVWTSRVAPGQWARRHGLFLIPEETRPPPILRRLDQELRDQAHRAFSHPRDGLIWVLSDPQVFQIHRSLTPVPARPKSTLEQHRLEGLRLKWLYEGPDRLSSRERLELLMDIDTLEALREEQLRPTDSSRSPQST